MAKNLAKSLHTISAISNVAHFLTKQDSTLASWDAIDSAMTMLNLDGLFDEYRLKDKAQTALDLLLVPKVVTKPKRVKPDWDAQARYDAANGTDNGGLHDPMRSER